MVMALTTDLSAQISLGLQGGVNISKTVVDNENVQPKISSINSFTFGAIINYKINSIISLQSELRYLRSGNEQNMSGPEKVIDHFDYLEIPIYAVAGLPNLLIIPFALVGINMGYLLKATQKYYFHNDDFTEFFNKTNFSIDVGLGVKYSFYENIWIQLSGRYSYGIYNIEKELGNRKMRGLQILLGVLYDI
jgi:opacity protein-like surface antigen